MIRTINTKEITKNVKEMCIEANHFLSQDMDAAMKKATAEEKSELGKKILNQLQMVIQKLVQQHNKQKQYQFIGDGLLKEKIVQIIQQHKQMQQIILQEQHQLLQRLKQKYQLYLHKLINLYTIGEFYIRLLL